MAVLKILMILLITCFSLGVKQCTDVDDPIIRKIIVMDCVKNCDSKGPCIQSKLNDGTIELRVYTNTNKFGKDYMSLSYDHFNALIKQAYKLKQCCDNCK